MCFLCVAMASGGAVHPQHMELSAAPMVRSAAFTTGADYVQPLLYGFSWGGTFNRASTVEYTFDATFNEGSKSSLLTQQIAREAMQQWSNVANITFTEGTNTSPLQFSTKALPADGDSETLGLATFLNIGTLLNRVEVQIDDSYAEAPQINRGGLGYQTMLHEIGHAIGLKHPFDDESGDGTTLDSTDSWDYTVMSYTAGESVTEANPIIAPMLLDIAAAQYLYGANTSYHAGNDSYVIDGTKAQSYAIWDGGGSDSVIASTSGLAALIDLTDTPDFENEFRNEDRTAGLNKIGSTVFFAAFGSNLEYAKGNSANDTIDGNDNANTLLGSGGNDILDGWDNNDTLFGGQAVADANDGNDLIRGDFGADTIYGNTGNDTLFGGGGLFNADGYDLADTVRAGTKEDDFTSVEDFDISMIYHDDTDQADTIYGGYGRDLIFGNGDRDVLYGGGAASDKNDGADTMIGGRGNDTLYGNGGNDLIVGGHGLSDTLDGADVIYGGFGNDTIYGNAGRDVIWSNQGDDYIHGGGDGDLYVFHHGSGVDTILQFQSPGATEADVIYIYEFINGTSIDHASDMLSRITYLNNRAEIDLGAGNKILVLGLGTAQLTVDDFFVFGL